jgi:type I restriction enzyme S subunit
MIINIHAYKPKPGKHLGQANKHLVFIQSENFGLIAVRPHTVTSEYLYFVILNAARSGGFVDETRGVNIHHIGRAGLAQFVIPVPPMEEQEEIVRRVKAAFARIEKVSEQASRAAELVKRLDEATLAAAFRGTLVASVQS